MARITELDLLTDVEGSDLLLITDVSTGKSKRITKDGLLESITKVTSPGVTTDSTAESTIRYKVQGRLNSLNLTIKGVNYPTKNTWTKIAQLNNYTGDNAYFFTATVDSGADTASSVIVQIDNTGAIMINAPKTLTNSVVRGCCSWIN